MVDAKEMKRLLLASGRFKNGLEVVRPALSAQNVTDVVASYSGSGDEGALDHISYHDCDNEEIEFADVQVALKNVTLKKSITDPDALLVSSPLGDFSLHKDIWGDNSFEVPDLVFSVCDILDVIFDKFINKYNNGYENNHSGGGTITINLASGKIVHDTYFMVTDHSTESLCLADMN